MEGSIVRRLRDPRCRYTARAMVTVQLKSAGVSMHFRPHRHSRPVYGSLNESTEEGSFDSARSSPRFLLSRPFFSSGKLFIVRRQPLHSFQICINLPIERFPYCWILRESVYQLSYVIIISHTYIYIFIFIGHLNRDIYKYTRFHKFGESVLGEFNSDMRSW